MVEGPILVTAPAKVNIWLHVRPRDESGRHPLFTLFQAITWFDDLEMAESDDDALEVSGAELPEGSENLVWKAVETMRAHGGDRGRRLSLRLTKRIPVAAGLGGGSADAAAALVGMKALEGAAADPADLAEVGSAIGADVPFALRGGTALGEGYGDRLSDPDPVPGGYALAVVVPPIELSTAEVYAAWDRLGEPEGRPAAGRSFPPSLRTYAPLRNDLEPAARALAPELDDWRADLEDLWGGPVLMSGSGPALLGFFGDEDEAEGAVAAVPMSARGAASVLPHPRGAERTDHLN